MPAPTLPPDRGWMGDPKRGASVGRPDRVYNPLSASPWLGTRRLYLRRVRINSQGYDSGGSYWGIGEPLWWATDGEGVDLFRRAPNREAAKAIIRQQFPKAEFHR